MDRPPLSGPQRWGEAHRIMHLQQRILVTGGSGFLGSHLCECLLSQGAEVICLDNFFTGARRNIEHLLEHKRFELIRHDITFPIYLEIDQIYNLACPASPIHYQRDPVQTTKTSGSNLTLESRMGFPSDLPNVVVGFQAALSRFVAEANDDPKPFTWLADPNKSIVAVRRGYQVLDSIH